MILGPFITPTDAPDLSGEGFRHTGYGMELVADCQHFMLAIYKDVSHLDGRYASFDEFYFPEPPRGWPVDFRFRSVHERSIRAGLMVSISPVIREVFRALAPATDLEGFLRELRSLIPVSANREPGWMYKPTCPVNLTEELAAKGFTVAEIMSFGVTLTVDLAWTFRDDYEGWQKIAAGHMEFRPRCGKLNEGKWNRHDWRERIEDHFYNRFEAIAPEKPIDCFRAEEDLDNLLSHFEWTPTTRHSAAEIRQMRVELVKSARHLWDAPRELAELLQKEALYSPNTSIHQIVKFLPSLMAEAGANGSDRP